jgi:hypothetical protein
MAKSVLYMSMSLDGFITGPDDGPGNGLGKGLARSLLREGLLDKLEIHLTRALEASGVTLLHYRVVK